MTTGHFSCDVFLFVFAKSFTFEEARGSRINQFVPTFFPTWVGVRFTARVIPNQLPAAVVRTGVLIVSNPITLLSHGHEIRTTLHPNKKVTMDVKKGRSCLT